MKTDVIRYNLKDTGRTFRGQPRNFDIPRMVAVINGGQTQERVKNRDMLGYYGHWPRLKFGMLPQEGGVSVVDGKARAVAVEPALVTTSLQAYGDGTIEHQAEFLDTNAGKVAAKLHSGRAGGFSSAVDRNQTTFFGFDYVLEPNFTGNRGYLMDSAGEADDESLILDSVAAVDYAQHLAAVLGLMEALQRDIDSERQANRLLLDSVGVLEAENEAYLSALAAGATLDSANGPGIKPRVLARDAELQIRNDVLNFRSADLQARNRIDSASSQSVDQGAAGQSFLKRLFAGL